MLKLNKNSCEIKDGKLSISYGETRIWQQDIRNMFSYSCSKPWKIEKTNWIIEKMMNNRVILSDEQIRVNGKFNSNEEGLSIEVSYENISGNILKDFTGILVLHVPGEKNKVTIPHMIYNDNPSAAADRIIPHVGTQAGKGVIFEEHRLPIPAVNVEWKKNNFYYLSLLSVPDITAEEEAYWSVGALYQQGGHDIIALTGALMFNGMKDVLYGGKCTPLPYMSGYRRLNPNQSLHKRYVLDWGRAEGEGKGFRNLIDLGYKILKPENAEKHSLEEMIRYKRNVLDSRFYREEDSAGYCTFGYKNTFGNLSGRPEYYLYAWTGQALKLSWCDCMMGLEYSDEERFKRGMETADFFVRGSEGEIPGLLRCYYVIEEKQWKGDWKNRKAPLSSRMEGESLSDLIDIMLLLRNYGKEIPDTWEKFVQRVCNFLMDSKYQTTEGFYPLAWGTEGTSISRKITAAGMPCVIALAKASEYFGRKDYLQYSMDKYNLYAHYHMDTFEIPFACSTMDAHCEDKESGIYAFLGAALLFHLTKKEIYRKWAEISGDWILTFVYFWETGFCKDSCCGRKNFHTTGWPGVSVQNHHLDVYFPMYEMYAYGKESGEERYCELAWLVRKALTNGVCTWKGEWGFSVIGEQGEHYYQTNYSQSAYPGILGDFHNWRGGMRTWNPSWITALNLQGSLKFYDLEKSGNTLAVCNGSKV